MKELVMLAPLLKHYKGYEYFRECVRLVRENQMTLTAVTKELYLPVARKFHTSSTCVERDIRTLCSYVWKHGGREVACRHGFPDQERAPMNKICIAMAVELGVAVDQAQNQDFVPLIRHKED